MNDRNAKSMISGAQLAAMLLMTDIFALFCMRGSLSPLYAAGYVLGCGVQLIMALPAAVMYRSGQSMCRTAKALSLAYLIIWGGELFRMLWDASGSIFIPPESSGGLRGRLLTAGLIAAVCVYAASEGIKPLARASVIAAALGAVCIFIAAVSAGAASGAEPLSFSGTSDELSRGFSASFVLGGGIGSLAVLLGRVRDSTLRTAVRYFCARAAAAAVVIVSSYLAVGRISEITEYPVITAAQLTQPFPTQRIDSLFMVIFAVFAIFSIAVQTLAAAEILAELLPVSGSSGSIASAAAMLAAALLPDCGGICTLLRICAAAAVLTVIPSVQLIIAGIGRCRQ